MKDKLIEKVRQQMIERYPDFVHDRESAKKRIEKISHGLEKYFMGHGLQRGIVGMSGGLDSTVVAALLKKANIKVTGMIIPIHQKPDETRLGLIAAKAFCDVYSVIDLTEQYEMLAKKLNSSRYYSDGTGGSSTRFIDAVNLGNMKARLRMIALYDEARLRNAVVMSTDNYSEYLMGFWTIYGDAGDVSPIQFVFKGFELPLIAKELNVPEEIIDAVPTDGLGISESDADQLGGSYKFVDAVMCSYMGLVSELSYFDMNNLNNFISISEEVKREDSEIRLAASKIIARHEKTEFKRQHPIQIENEIDLFKIKNK